MLLLCFSIIMTKIILHLLLVQGDEQTRDDQLDFTLKKYKAALQKAKKLLQDEQDRADRAERALKVAKATKKKGGRVKRADTEAIKQFKSELRAHIKYDFGRSYKFLPKNAKKWSDKEKSLCQRIIQDIKWPESCKDEDKMQVWSDVLAPALREMLTEFKNKIHQPMRATFNSKCVTSKDVSSFTN